MIVLDTHVLLWLALDSAKLSPRAKSVIAEQRAEGGLAIAAISLWEIAMYIKKGEIRIKSTPEAWIQTLIDKTTVSVLSISPQIAVLSVFLPDDFHKDPADRLIVATARVHGTLLITKDAKIREYRHVETIW